MSQSKEPQVTLVNTANKPITFYADKVAHAVDAGKEVTVSESAAAYLKGRGYPLEPKKK